MGWQRWNLFLLLLDRAKLSVLILRKGNKPSMTFAISGTKEAAQLLTLDYQSKIVHHGNVELSEMLQWNIYNMHLEKLSIEEKGKVKENVQYRQEFPLITFWGKILNIIFYWLEGKMFIQSVSIKPLRGKRVRGGETLGGKRGLRKFT